MIEHKKVTCNSCGSDMAPTGAKFCPNCGTSLADDRAAPPQVIVDEAGYPVASAVIIDDDDDMHNISSTTSPSTGAAPPPNFSTAAAGFTGSTAAATDYTTSNNFTEASSSSAAAAAAAAADHHDGGALYFKNPSPEMIAKSNSQVSGGILFIQGPSVGGKFTVPKTLNVGHILSGEKVDLSMADFVHPITTIYVGTILGGIKIFVPPGVRVETSGIGILGGFKGVNDGCSHRRSRSSCSSRNLHSHQPHAGQDAPTIQVTGLSILGGVKVIVNDKVPPVRIVE